MRYSLKRKSDFDRLFKKGKKGFSGSLMILYSPAKETRIGISVGKKHGNSVVRNRVKRLLRAAVREEISSIKGNYHIVILPKPCKDKADYRFAVYRKDIHSVFYREKITVGDKKISDRNSEVL